MPSAYEKLDKILQLEQSRGCEDQAVIGGLEKFVHKWREEALAESSDPVRQEQIEEIASALAQYGELMPARRAEIIREVLARIEAGPVAQQEPRRPPLQKPGSAPAQLKGSAPGVEMPSAAVQQVDASPLPASQVEPPVTPAPLPVASRPASGLDAPVNTLPGVSTAFTSRLQRLGIETVGDLLRHFPRRYDDYSKLKPINQLEYGEETTIIGTIWETRTHKTRSGGVVVTSVIADASGTIEATWFNQPYLARQLRGGRRIVLSGRVDEYLGRLTMQSPVWEPLEKELIHTGRLVPIYPLTQGISARWMRRLVKRVVDHWAPRLQDYLPISVRERNGLMDLSTAVSQIHFPDSEEAAQAAHRRLSFDEFLFIQLGMLRKRQEWRSREGTPIPANESLLTAFLQALPFELTEAQHRSLDQIVSDMARDVPMSRLLQGDVGSGKTVVAAAAILMVVAAGKQATLMAPTEILAEQHYRTLSEILAGAAAWGMGRSVSVSLLTGSVGRVERRDIYDALASGKLDVVVGTHALIQRHVVFDDLGLVIVDEQHRFGVTQRSALRGKGTSPHVLVMSATPIPRSLALTIYGDLEISVVDQMPPGRQPIQTRWLLARERERAYAFVRSQIEKGRQVFILYPLVEESDKVEARAAVDEHERLRTQIFPDLQLGLLHGRMKSDEKDKVMQRFRTGEIDVLVSTSVIEVGIDVPNATVMLIEGADRFGLAQLHQFRGRVGRGEHQSYCLLLSDKASPDDPETHTTWERLKAIEETQDGFALAEKDLELRGPGDFFGVRQSGLPALRLASLSNTRTLELARAEAAEIFELDPDLGDPQHHLLAGQMARFWQGKADLS
ncbi:MAG: ATP-dependent DNA helicase RecG [Anaerolineae bacterium]|nr:ATP-dependent DNA helicase RecG [Anaerolineae bacterium]